MFFFLNVKKKMYVGESDSNIILLIGDNVTLKQGWKRKKIVIQEGKKSEKKEKENILHNVKELFFLPC